MTRITSLNVAFAVTSKAWSWTDDNWRLIVDIDGVDVLSNVVHPEGGFGVAVVDTARGFPGEGYARVYTFSEAVLPGTTDWVPAMIDIETSELSGPSLRLETTGSNMLRLDAVVVWGTDAAGAVVPIALQTDVPNLSLDSAEGRASIALGLVDSGDDATTFTEILAYVSVGTSNYAETDKPVMLRFSRSDGSLVEAQSLDGFDDLRRDGEHDAMVWSLTGLAPLSRAIAGGPLEAALRVDGPNNAEIARVIVFGVDRSAARPRVVPLVVHSPRAAGTNPWVGTTDGIGGRDMPLPLAPIAPR